ncbi:uncharacterized protein LOC134782079 [Penaeus indicus]|uniref:uncharacterized protein LOC134782079 n=1 Tax=Penaeus indicus TaxID=29960 RepID=UPI00300D5CD1
MLPRGPGEENMGQRVDLSPGDIAWVDRMYGCSCHYLGDDLPGATPYESWLSATTITSNHLAPVDASKCYYLPFKSTTVITVAFEYTLWDLPLKLPTIKDILTGNTRAGTTQHKLTPNGIQYLYCINPEQRQITVQVVYFAFFESRYFLRVTDGQALSPIVIMEKSVYGSDFGLGDVIMIKQRAWHSDDKPDWQKGLEDNDFWHIYITDYTVSAHFASVGQVIGTYDEKAASYREAVGNIRHFLEDKSNDMNVSSLISLNPLKVEAINKSSTIVRDCGTFSHKLKDYRSAVDDFSKAVRRDLYNSTTWSNCSQTFLRTRDYVEAEQFAIIALKFNPFHEKSYIRLVQSALARGNTSLAQQYARAAKFMCRTHQSAKAFLKAFARFEDPASESTTFIQPFPVRTPGQIYAFRYSTKIKLTFPGKKMEFDENTKYTEVANQEWELEIMPMDPEDAPSLLRKELARIASNECRNNIMKWVRKSDKYEEEKETQNLVRQLLHIYKMKRDRKRREENIRRKNQQLKMKKNVKIRIQKELEIQRELKEKMHQRELSMMRKMNVDVKPQRKTKPLNHHDTFQETLENGKRFFEEHHYRQAVQAFEKIMEVHLKKHKGDLKEIQFATALCEIHSGRGYITDGMDILRILVDDVDFALAARYWLAVSYEKICMFKAAGTYAKSCIEEQKENRNYRGNMWPGTAEIIPETTPAYLAKGSKELLERLTSSVPAPKAKCHLSNCCSVQGHAFAKQEIYLQDLEFKGYINVTCEEDCVISFHHVCWKSVKEQDKDAKKTEKDFLGTECITPDCSGLIYSITIYDNNNEIKLELVKDKKRNDSTVKEKKKKDKKREKPPGTKPETREKKKEKQGGASMEAAGLEQKVHFNDTVKDPDVRDTTQEMESTVSKAPALPIDPESLEWTNVTVLKPFAEEEQTDEAKSIKKKKKKKKKKATPQADLLGDPLDASENVENEYVARLKLLKQEKEEKMMSNAQLRKLKRARALEKKKTLNNEASDDVGELPSECQHVPPIDPNNPFFIPEELREDNVKFEQYLKGEKFGGKTLDDPPPRTVVPCYDGDISINIPSRLQETDKKNKTESTSSPDSNEDLVTGAESAACADLRAEILNITCSDVDVDVTCSICLEPYDDFVSETLDCEHRFHRKCIRYWLKQQSNCPNCRKFALTEEDYPSLLDARKWLLE